MMTGVQVIEKAFKRLYRQRWGKVEPAVWGRRRYSFTHRTKVFADGTKGVPYRRVSLG